MPAPSVANGLHFEGAAKPHPMEAVVPDILLLFAPHRVVALDFLGFGKSDKLFKVSPKQK